MSMFHFRTNGRPIYLEMVNKVKGDVHDQVRECVETFVERSRRQYYHPQWAILEEGDPIDARCCIYAGTWMPDGALIECSLWLQLDKDTKTIKGICLPVGNHEITDLDQKFIFSVLKTGENAVSISLETEEAIWDVQHKLILD